MSAVTNYTWKSVWLAIEPHCVSTAELDKGQRGQWYGQSAVNRGNQIEYLAWLALEDDRPEIILGLVWHAMKIGRYRGTIKNKTTDNLTLLRVLQCPVYVPLGLEGPLLPPTIGVLREFTPLPFPPFPTVPRSPYPWRPYPLSLILTPRTSPFKGLLTVCSDLVAAPAL